MIKYSMEFPIAERSFWLPFCDMEFVLAHKVLEDQDYALELRNRSAGSPPVILDNSMHELGQPLEAATIAEAARRCHPDWVIPPDRLGQWSWNLEQLKIMKPLLHPKWKLAAVMCGATAFERSTTLSVAASLGCEMMCYPYREARRAWVEEHFRALVISGPVTHIHLLGVSSLQELRDWEYMSRHGLRSINISVDTAKAYKWGMSGDDISVMDNLRSSPLGSSALLDVKMTPDERLRPIIQNIHTLKAVCRGR